MICPRQKNTICFSTLNANENLSGLCDWLIGNKFSTCLPKQNTKSVLTHPKLRIKRA